MGMYTATKYCCLELREDTKENREELKKICDEETGGWENILHIDNAGNVELNVNWKIVGYWYTQTLVFLVKLDKYITGTWHLEYEEGDQLIITFYDDDTGIQIEMGNIVWAKPQSILEFADCVGHMEAVLEALNSQPSPSTQSTVELGKCVVCGSTKRLRNKEICEPCWVDVALDSCERGECNHCDCHGEECNEDECGCGCEEED